MCKILTRRDYSENALHSSWWVLIFDITGTIMHVLLIVYQLQDCGSVVFYWDHLCLELNNQEALKQK